MTNAPRSVEVRLVLPEDLGQEFEIPPEQVEAFREMIRDGVEYLAAERAEGVEQAERRRREEQRNRERSEAVGRIDWNKWREEIGP